jgi:hypothetical protein
VEGSECLREQKRVLVRTDIDKGRVGGWMSKARGMSKKAEHAAEMLKPWGRRRWRVDWVMGVGEVQRPHGRATWHNRHVCVCMQGGREMG